MSEWISVKELDGDHNVCHLYCTESGGVYLCGGKDHGFLVNIKLPVERISKMVITHWMPLPKPPDVIQ